MKQSKVPLVRLMWMLMASKIRVRTFTAIAIAIRAGFELKQ